MSKTKAKAPDYGKATTDLAKRVKHVVAEAEKHRYSVSAVYAAYNEAFDKRDLPQTCSSCVRNRVRELRDWLKGYEKYNAEKSPMQAPKTPAKENGKKAQTKGQDGPENVNPDGGNANHAPAQYDDPAAPGFVAPAAGVIRTPMAEGLPFDFTADPENPMKGSVKLADGASVKPGTYKTAQGIDIAVQVGGKATIKEAAPGPNDDITDIFTLKDGGVMNVNRHGVAFLNDKQAPAGDYAATERVTTEGKTEGDFMITVTDVGSSVTGIPDNDLL